ncbi:hypothetical protein KAFR_0K02520 [Kazachstania africana CBS 2517]|uniref:Mitochondrial fusion and transport protein UGO1 n=1 Tax=Kazachstania africana (strain ATCC 22294 / BCRC 22015 / CBS 2517 / CECT 1963 / NBRC 1671 / NRRL Y-8276) TaxID=1071382 RepID=H2B1V8_KAZAF|nr:hypothetical protein KAFR_0K02520 [Kazachstania africana CBS 2517]CCF60608.1 hypothetical protein KAFR_0K02520 [Kazachstania africana CBS 2517]
MPDTGGYSTTQSMTSSPVVDRSQVRPYYNASTFNVGYSSIFHPDRGVVDQNGNSIASKLSSSADKNNPFSNIKNQSSMLHNLISNKKYPHAAMSLGSPIINWNDFFNFAKWESTVWKFLFTPYLKNLIQTPFENCKIIMQTATIDDPSNVNDQRESAKDDNTDDEIDFFPIYTMKNAQTHKREPIAPLNDAPVLKLKRLDTLTVMKAIKDHKKLGVKSLWRSNNISFVHISLSKMIKLSMNKILPIMLPNYYNLNFTKILAVKIINSFITEVILFPLDLYKLTKLVSLQEPGSLIDFYHSITFNQFTMTLYALTFSKISLKKAFENGLDFLIYYYLNFSNLNNNKFLAIIALKFFSESIKFLLKLPLETLIHRYQIDYLQKTRRINSSNLIITPVNITTSAKWKGLWNGWKIGLVSLFCDFTFKIMNKIDDDLKQEKF